MIAPTSEVGAIQANSRQLSRPLRQCAYAAVRAAAPEIATLAPAAAAALLPTSTMTGKRRLPSTSPTIPPKNETANDQTMTRISSAGLIEAEKLFAHTPADGRAAVRDRRRAGARADRPDRGRAARCANAAAHPRRAGWAETDPRSRLGAADRDRGGQPAQRDPLRPARFGEDDACPDCRRAGGRRLRGGVG